MSWETMGGEGTFKNTIFWNMMESHDNDLTDSSTPPRLLYK